MPCHLTQVPAPGVEELKKELQHLREEIKGLSDGLAGIKAEAAKTRPAPEERTPSAMQDFAEIVREEVAKVLMRAEIQGVLEDAYTSMMRT